jgi:drug/metabolite transporter (DMT)-like permease
MSSVFSRAWGKKMQRLWSLKLNLAVAICLAGLSFPAAALGVIPEHHGGGSTSTPAPIAGAGLVAIGVAGAAIYMAVRRFRKPD